MACVVYVTIKQGWKVTHERVSMDLDGHETYMDVLKDMCDGNGFEDGEYSSLPPGCSNWEEVRCLNPHSVISFPLLFTQLTNVSQFSLLVPIHRPPRHSTANSRRRSYRGHHRQHLSTISTFFTTTIPSPPPPPPPPPTLTTHR